MKVLLINTSDRTGGAAVATSRLMESLNNAGVETKMLVLHKTSSAEKMIPIGKPWQRKFTFIWERLTIWTHNLFSRKNLFTVSIANTGFNITRLPEFKEADIIHLHWINQGMLSLTNLQEIKTSGKPIIWTLHDMWPCTGICHHAHTCNRFKSECKDCPFLRFPGEKDLSNKVFRKKQRLFQNSSPEIVAVSTWLASQVAQSTLLKDKHISVIPNTLSLDEFKWLDKETCRRELALPGKYILLFGAARIDDPIKGFKTLLEAIRLLIKQQRFPVGDLHLILFGRIKYPENVLPFLPISYSDFGWVTDASLLSKLYSAADITVSASLYETFGQTLIEAQACGCLPVSFGNSGQADIIQHKENGYLVSNQSAESLAEGIEWGITEGQSAISKAGMRQNVLNKYSGTIVADQYIQLYKNRIETK